MKKFLKAIGMFFVVLVVIGIGAAIAGITGSNDKPEEKHTVKVEQKVDTEATKKKEEEAKKKAEEEKVRAQVEKAKAEEVAKKKAEEEKAKKLQAEEAINLGMNSAEFEHNWANLSADIDSDMLLREPEFESGSVKDTKSYTVTENAGVVTTIHKGNHMIKDITVIAMPSQDELENTRILLTFALAIGSADPLLTPDERGEVFTGLTDQNPNLDEKDVYYIKNGIKYGLLISKQTGMWLNISPEAAK